MNSKAVSKISLIYKIIFSLIIISGFLIRSQFNILVLFSFTILSNIFVLVLTIATIYFNFQSRNKYSENFQKLRSLSVMLILTTGLIYHFVILPESISQDSNYNVFLYHNIVGHYVVPLGMFIDWLLFDDKGHISRKEPLICLSIPIVYFLLYIIYYTVGSLIKSSNLSAIYFFMDVNTLDYIHLIKWALALLLCILLVNYSIYFLDKFLYKKENKKLIN